jgi:hypothetical protein
MNRRGLTLLEVLISMVVLVMAVSTILPLFAVGSASHKRGMDQSQMAWLAPRVAARLQERLYDANPKPVKGYVQEFEDGSLVLDDAAGKGFGAAYRFEASFMPIMTGPKDPIGASAFLLKVDLSSLEGGEPRVETYETVVLRKLLR